MSHTAYPGQPLLTCRQVALDLAVVGLLRVAVDRQLHILICQLPIVSAELQEIGSLDTFAELQQRVLIFGDALHVVLTREKEILDIVVALHGSTLTMVELVVPVHFSRGRVIEVVSTCQEGALCSNLPHSSSDGARMLHDHQAFWERLDF
jgi:hypothetical protein